MCYCCLAHRVHAAASPRRPFFLRGGKKGTPVGAVYRAQGPARRWQLGGPTSELAYEPIPGRNYAYSFCLCSSLYLFVGSRRGPTCGTCTGPLVHWSTARPRRVQGRLARDKAARQHVPGWTHPPITRQSRTPARAWLAPSANHAASSACLGACTRETEKQHTYKQRSSQGQTDSPIVRKNDNRAEWRARPFASFFFPSHAGRCMQRLAAAADVTVLDGCAAATCRLLPALLPTAWRGRAS
eukprot:5634899-Pyramimonas_sp.AAC.2